MRRTSRLPLKAAVPLCALALVASALLGTAPVATAAGCGHIHLRVSKHRVKPGHVLRVSGTTCKARSERPRVLRIKLRTRHGWQKIGISRTRSTGHFSRRVRVPEPGQAEARTSTARIQVVAPDAQSPSVPIKVTDPSANCPLDEPGSTIGATVQGCRLVASDTASEQSPMSFWGRVDCGVWPNLATDRPERPTSGGDTHPTATGEAQGDSDFRRMTVFDGDDVAGERCELGLNDSQEGPTAFYKEGDRRVTYVSIRLPENFPLDAEAWQTILQMKQAQPANNGGGVPILFMEAFDGTYFIDSDHGIHWEFPAQKNVWTRFMFDVTYSQDPSKGSVEVAADLNDDGDFDDPGERSPRVQTATMRAETPGPDDTIAPGASIPDHLRAGIYHDPSIPCPRPVGCSTEIDNVQVVAPTQ